MVRALGGVKGFRVMILPSLVEVFRTSFGPLAASSCPELHWSLYQNEGTPVEPGSTTHLDKICNSGMRRIPQQLPATVF